METGVVMRRVKVPEENFFIRNLGTIFILSSVVYQLAAIIMAVILADGLIFLGALFAEFVVVESISRVNQQFARRQRREYQQLVPSTEREY